MSQPCHIFWLPPLGTCFLMLCQRLATELSPHFVLVWGCFFTGDRCRRGWKQENSSEQVQFTAGGSGKGLPALPSWQHLPSPGTGADV